MNTLQCARKTHSEDSEKIKGALNHQLKTYVDEIYNNGRKDYNRKGYIGWKVPDVVQEKDGLLLSVVQEGSHFWVNLNHLLKVNNENTYSKLNNAVQHS